ncbi:MAG: acetylxylan esterase, partial [Verrucomicrobiae bacterium]|nr:acetylxylan esterase [Verrucomicrobiae bacterium]
MNRRDFLKVAGVSPFVAVVQAAVDQTGAGRLDVKSRFVRATTIRDYLVRQAMRITRNAVAIPLDANEWKNVEARRRRQFLEMMGLAHLPNLGKHDPVNATVTGVLQRQGYKVEKLHFESLPDLHVTANLYVPAGIEGPVPAVLYLCGHANNQKFYYQAHPRRFAELGFVCLIVETIQLGEVPGYHHGCYREGWFHWYSLGYTPAGVELLNAIRALDYLAQRPEVDKNRLGVTGISGGGATSWWLAAANTRVKVAAPVCGTATLYSHIHDRTIDGHCDCMWWINFYQWDLADVGALIAPRPLLIASADRDSIFTLESVRVIHSKLATLYERLGVPQNLKLVITPGGHSYHRDSRTAIFSWFVRHLQGREVPPDQVGDIDENPARNESVNSLRVYVLG